MLMYSIEFKMFRAKQIRKPNPTHSNTSFLKILEKKATVNERLLSPIISLVLCIAIVLTREQPTHKKASLFVNDCRIVQAMLVT